MLSFLKFTVAIAIVSAPCVQSMVLRGDAPFLDEGVVESSLIQTLRARRYIARRWLLAKRALVENLLGGPPGRGWPDALPENCQVSCQGELSFTDENPEVKDNKSRAYQGRRVAGFYRNSRCDEVDYVALASDNVQELNDSLQNQPYYVVFKNKN